jgi:hypothetical protein
VVDLVGRRTNVRTCDPLTKRATDSFEMQRKFFKLCLIRCVEIESLHPKLKLLELLCRPLAADSFHCTEARGGSSIWLEFAENLKTVS